MSSSQTPTKTIKVLVVDDSALMRQSVRRVLDAEPDIEVLDIARDGLEALLKVEQLQPDVVTMDVEMPRLDGLATLKLLMERLPRPVVMFSSLTDQGTDATIRALALGAVDFMVKPTVAGSAGMSSIAAELVQKVRHAAGSRVTRLSSAAAAAAAAGPPTLRAPLVSATRPSKLVVIGSSTGGPRALADLTRGLPAQIGAALLLVQHLPAGFTRSLADRLDQGSALSIGEARQSEPLLNDRGLMAPGDFHMQLSSQRVALDQGPKLHGVRPSVDVTLKSAAATFGSATLAVILTGMGEDGRDGCRAVKEAGGRVLAEAESSCVVYGMPRAVADAGLADEIVPLDRMAEAIIHHIALLEQHAARRAVHV